jgi:CHAT domain-containing protein
VLPSISSLKILRTASGRPAASQAYLGFGDPIFDGGQGARPADSSRFLVGGPAGLTRSAHFDFDRLKTLKISPLPHTALELDTVARALGVPQSHIKLRQNASEHTVKSLKLDDYRILHFATHALKVDDPAAKAIGLREPALMLTIPAASSADDDGVLTSSEIAALKLNADWVILSACNTAAGDKPGAEDLSGLARAFFYAGARTLMVSHWEVYDDAGAALITKAVQALEQNPALSPAEVLRLSMLAWIDDARVPTNAHPSNWAPFVIVGTVPLK